MKDLRNKIIGWGLIILMVLGGVFQQENILNLVSPASLTRLTITQDETVLDDCINKYSQIIVDANNVTVTKCTLINGEQFAGGILVLGNNNIISNNDIDGACRAGIVVHGQFNIVENNEVQRTKDCIQGTSHSDADGIRVLNSNNTVRGNYIHDLNPERATFPHTDGIQGDFPSYQFKNVLIENNIIDSLNAGIQTDGLACDNVTIRGNTIRGDRPLNMSCDNTIITNNSFYGISLVSFLGIRSGSSNIVFTDNTVCNTTEGIITSVGTVTQGGDNIFYNISGKAPRRDSGYNYIDGKLAWVTDKWQIFTPICSAFPIPGAITPTLTKIPTVSLTPSTTSTITNTGVPTVTVSKTLTKVPTITLTQSQTPSPTVSRTPTPIVTKTSTPTKTPTSTPAPGLCVKITNWPNVSIRLGKSTSFLSVGAYNWQKIIPIEGVETDKISGDQWARVNYLQYFAVKLGTRQYAKISPCQ